MPDPHVISALEDKAHDLRQAIVSYEEHLDRTRHELAVVTATIAIMGRDGHRLTDQRPAHIRNLFKRGEALALCKAALAVRPDSTIPLATILGEYPEGLTTRELAISCLAAKGYASDDPVLVRAMVGLLSNTLKKAVRRGELARADRGQREALWVIPKPARPDPSRSSLSPASAATKPA